MKYLEIYDLEGFLRKAVNKGHIDNIPPLSNPRWDTHESCVGNKDITDRYFVCDQQDQVWELAPFEYHSYANNHEPDIHHDGENLSEVKDNARFVLRAYNRHVGWEDGPDIERVEFWSSDGSTAEDMVDIIEEIVEESTSEYDRERGESALVRTPVMEDYRDNQGKEYTLEHFEKLSNVTEKEN